MNPFPFAADEWDLVSAASLRVVNATLADDDVLRASCFIGLQAALDELRSRHGEHPVLLETEADFTDDFPERDDLYKRAKVLALRHQLPTLSIRLALARMYLEVLRQPEQARQELKACENELIPDAKDDLDAWHELMIACRST